MFRSFFIVALLSSFLIFMPECAAFPGGRGGAPRAGMIPEKGPPRAGGEESTAAAPQKTPQAVRRRVPGRQGAGEQEGEKVKISPDIGLCVNASLLAPARRAKLFELLEPFGKRILRVDFRWSLIEPEKGRFEWNRTDGLVDDVVAAGHELLPILMGAPAWAGGSDEAAGVWPPSSPGDYASFVAAVVSRYKGKIRCYELWNEPNVPRFWGGKRAEPEAFLALLKAGYEAGKKADPGAVFVMGGITHLASDQDFLKDLFRLGALKYCDVVGVHLYPKSVEAFASQVKALLAALGRMKARQKVWVTETGWPSREVDLKKFLGFLEKRGITREQFKKSVVLRRAVGWVYDFNADEARRSRDEAAREEECKELGVTNKDIEEMLKKAVADRRDSQGRDLFMLSRFVEESPRLGKIFWYQFQDTMEASAKEANFGLVDAKGGLKPAYRLMAGKIDKRMVEKIEKKGAASGVKREGLDF